MVEEESNMKYEEIYKSTELVVVSYGGGVNSTAMLIGMQARGQVPDAILFADTGAEFPETIDYVEAFSGWLMRHGMPAITTVRYKSKHVTLEQECINNGTLPGLAFGFKGCSVKWKRQPMDKWVKTGAREAFERGGKIHRLIGIDADEQHRGKNLIDPHLYQYHRPLIEWWWGREECETEILAAGLCLPRKSACFFCPAAKKEEVRTLARERRDLFDRAVALELNAKERGGLKQIKGLGRNWSWEQLGELEESQLRLFPEPPVEPCECYF